MQKAVEAQSSGSGTQGRVEIRNISKSYGEAWERQDVIAGLSLDVRPGQLTVVVGPSGCGKSTLVNLVAGFEQVDRGQILIDGQPVTGPGRDRMVVFQETALMPWQTALQNLVFGPNLRREKPAREIEEEAKALLVRVGLGDFMHKYPSQLSGGMQRRAELARALMNNPRLMIMDEPFRGLDAMSRGLMQEFFLRLFEETRRTNLFVTSEIDEALFLADRVVVLSNRPAQVRAVLDIALPRPRHYSMLSSPEAFEYKRQAMAILYEEAMRSFQKGAASADVVEAFNRRA